MDLNLLKKRTFKHVPFHFEELECITTDEGRKYISPQGYAYESVTTFLGRMSDKSGLDEWRKSVGEEKAREIMEAAAARGSLVHAHLEDFLMGKEVQGSDYHYMFNRFKPILRKNLDAVHAIEACLYSNAMKLAGRVDLIGTWQGELAIIDFKTSNKEKKEEYILNYFLQTTIYALMVRELMGIKITKIVILIGVENQSTRVQVFVKDIEEFIPILREMIEKKLTESR